MRLPKPYHYHIQSDILAGVNTVRRIRQAASLTQARLAALAGTSQPTIAQYESGAKSPTMRTLARIARSAGYDINIEILPAMTREDRRSLALHRAIATKLRNDPESVLASAQDMISLMKRMNPGAAPTLNRWADILRLPVEEITAILVDPGLDARVLRHVTPFAGVLTAPERAEVYGDFRQAS